jgi:hypothetical protein
MEAMRHKTSAFWGESQGKAHSLTFPAKTDILEHFPLCDQGDDARTTEHAGNDEAAAENAG